MEYLKSRVGGKFKEAGSRTIWRVRPLADDSTSFQWDSDDGDFFMYYYNWDRHRDQDPGDGEPIQVGYWHADLKGDITWWEGHQSGWLDGELRNANPASLKSHGW